MTTVVVLGGAGLVLILILVRWLVGTSAKQGAERERLRSIEASREAIEDARRHIDDPSHDLSRRRALARARRELRRRADDRGLPDPPAPSDHERGR